MDTWVDIVILALMAVTVFGIVVMRNLLSVVMLSGIYSLLAASIFVVMDAVDVAFTEAAVGAGISTILFIGTLALTTRIEKKPAHAPLLPLIVVCITGAVLIFGTLDAAVYGDPQSAAMQDVAPYYLENTKKHTGIPNVVTAVLASYRGYDTLGEVVVIFTAGIGVILLLGSWRRGLGRLLPHKDDNA
ncbi:MAG: DUF4040 domain-containing protein [Pseudomonadota bacterium]|nr:DUF4040 domain-containing protein [Pseudomonadota bacterium]